MDTIQPKDELRAIWAEVLDVGNEDVTSEAHFFVLGGDSLATAELVRLAISRGLRLSRQQVFEAPKFDDMAALVSSYDSTPSEEPQSLSLPPFGLVGADVTMERHLAAEQCSVLSEDIEDMYPTTALQAGLMARSVSAPGAYVSSWLFKTFQSVASDWLCEVLGQVVLKLPILRTAMVTSAEHSFVQVVLPPLPSTIEVVRVRSLQDLDVGARRPAMTLGKPLTKIDVVLSEDCKNPFVLWHAHHAIYDMSTLELIAQHLTQTASGVDNRLLSAPSYASFIAHSLEVRKNSEWRRFWAEQLQGCPTSCFPRAYPDVPINTFRTNARYTHSLPFIDAKFGFTVANTFRAAWAFLLAHYEHSNDVVFGVTNGGRYAPVPQCAEIVGPTISTTPMRIRLKREATVTEFLQQLSMQAVRINDFEQVGLYLIQQLGQDGQAACSFRSLVNVQLVNAGRESQVFTLTEPEQVQALDYALVLELFPRDDGSTVLGLSYDTHILRHQQIIQIALHLEGILRLFLTDTKKTLDEIETISSERRRDIDEKVVFSRAQKNNLCGTTEGVVNEPPKPLDLLPTPAHRTRKHASVECGVSEDAIQDIYPCTAMQASLIEVSTKHPTAYVSQTVFSVRDDITDHEVLGAWAALYNRVSVFRTRFFHASMGLSKIISPPGGMQLRLLQAVIDDEIPWEEHSDLEKYLAMDRRLKFGMGQALTSFTFIRDRPGGKARWVVLTAHNAVYDPSMTQAMLQILQDAISRNINPLPAAPFSLFVRYVLQYLNESSKTFWARKLRDCPTPPFPDVPTGHVALTTANMYEVTPWPAALCGMGGQISSSVLLQAAWALTLTQYYDSNEVILGVGFSDPLAGLANVQSILGPTMAIVPQRVTIDPEISISEYLQAVQELNLGLVNYAQYGLANIQTIDESCAAACNFQNLLVVRELQDGGGGRTSKPHAAFQPAEVLPSTTRYDTTTSLMYPFALVVEVTNIENGMARVSMSYDSLVLQRDQVWRLMTHYIHVLRQMCTISRTDKDLVRDIDHVPVEHLVEIQSWNNCVPAAVERGVHELFEAQAKVQPGCPAVCARDGEWSYSELDTLSEKLARSLRSLGVGPGKYVPLLFEKCGVAIVAMLAILKAGGASVALDPTHPEERLRNLVASMGDCLVLCSSENRLLAAGLARRAFVLNDKTLLELSNRPCLPRLSEESKIAADNTAFVLFTSGSTGMPKGIVIPHRAFASSIQGHAGLLRFSTGPGSRNFQFTAYTSDVSIGEIFTSLAVGSCVCVPSEWDRKNDIAGAMRDFAVNWAFFTPSVATMLGPSEVPLLRTLVFGGETATPENFQTWAPALHLINSFGPAECSIWSHCIPHPVTLEDFGSNIGFGVGCATWITDPADYDRLLPIGAIGELLVEGPNLAAGYLNEAVKTDKAFVTNPAWMPANRKYMRLYRTGDLARHLPNGMVQFLGRRDHQVKLRGLRIELGEIEHQIRNQLPDDVLVAVDVVTPYPAGSARILAAFIALKEPIIAVEHKSSEKSSSSVAQGKHNLLSLVTADGRLTGVLQSLETKLAGVLPGHMLPAAFVPLRDLPLTTSAKTDRKLLKLLASMLSAEELSRLGAATKNTQSPTTVMERVLARLWSIALGHSLDLDVKDSFFRIGGDSLSAMRLVSLARKDRVRLSVDQVFKYPTLQEMAQVAIVAEDWTGQCCVNGSDLLPEIEAFAALETAEASASAVLSASEQLGVDKTSIEDVYPCVPLQIGLLALSQDTRGSYVAQMVYELPSDIDLPRFESAWSSVFEDWPILRTRFFQWHTGDGASRSMQAVVKAKMRWVRSHRLSSYLQLDRRDRMQLGDRMLRLATVNDKWDHKHYFVMTLHHAIYDGWMLWLLFTAIRRAYDDMPKVETIPYTSFVSYVAARDHEASQRYWHGYVGDAARLPWPELPVLDFRPKPTAVCRRTAAFPSRDQQRNFTPTTLMRTAFGILLGAYSHADDVIFASTVYGRALGQTSAEKVIGPTMATIPIRVRMRQEKDLYKVMAQVQLDAAEMLAHEQEGMQNIKRYNRNALATIDTQSLLVVQVDGQSQDEDAISGLKLRPVAVSALDNGFLSSALVLEATISGEAIHLVATHDERIISPIQAERFLRQLSHILRQLCSAPEQSCLADLELIPPEDTEEMHLWNDGVPKPTKALVHELFVAQVQQEPDAEALVSWEGSLTYQQLDQLSSQLAGYLWTAWGLRSGIRVALLFEKSMWTVVAMLAVLKLGAANVALNPAHPPGRLRSLIEEVDAEFVLCSNTYQALAEEVAPRSFCVGTTTLLDDVQGSTNGAHGITPDHLAFLLFTSGSTGKPKAIMIDHTAFCSSINGHAKVLCYRKGSRNLQFTAYTSDVSIGEIFTSLSQGATVCIPSDDERLNNLAQAMERMRVDWAFLTPSVASLLNPDHVPTLRTLLFGGETATITNVQTWAPRVHLINSFGPAETSIWSHAHPHFSQSDDGSDIGPSLGCATWIVDPEDCNRLMPIGTIGELIVEGPNVAAGYYKNPEKTQASFLKRLPWLPSDRCNRIYRMGDLARWMPDGRVQFLGRKDGQVKLHGQRIEVGEVEHNIRIALGDNGREVAVEMISNPDDLADSRLIAFISCTPADKSQDRDHPAIITVERELQLFSELTGGLKEKLATRLAGYMIPSFYVPLTSMPLSASAKTDRKLLRALINNLGFSQLASFAVSSSQAVEPPQSSLEKLLHTMWCSILALPKDDFGIESDFFECGGDSIAAMKLVSLARTTNVSISVQDLFDYPRMADLARVLEEREPCSTTTTTTTTVPSDIAAFSLLPPPVQAGLDTLISEAAELCSVEPNQIVDIYPCTPSQRSVFKQSVSCPGAYWLHNVFEVPSQVDVSRLEQAWHLVVATHATLRTRIFTYDNRYLQAVMRSPPDAVQHFSSTSISQFLRTSKEQELTDGQSLLRVSMVTDPSHESDKRFFVLMMHHSIYDVWSLKIIFTSLERLYVSLEDPKVAKDNKKNHNHNNHNNEHLENGFKYFVKAVIEQDRVMAMDFWSKYLQGTKTKPFTQPVPVGNYQPNCLLRHKVSFPNAGAPRKGVTAAVMAYAAIGLAFHQQLQVSDTILRLSLFGRATPSVPDIEDLVGLTTTSVPLRINHESTNELQEYLSHVQTQVRRFGPFEQVGFEDISQIHADAAYACLSAPQVIVHPYDPYIEQPAAGIGLRRQELSAFNNDIPFLIDISLSTKEKALAALDIRVVFNDVVVASDMARQLIMDLEIIMQRMVGMQDSGPTVTVQEILANCESAKLEKDITWERIEREALFG